MDYLSFLAFIVATGLYWLIGPGGPLHTIDIQSFFRSQLNGDSASSNSVLLWLVIAPTGVFILAFVVLSGLFGGITTLVLGTAALFYAFGREDYPTLTQRFLARAKAGDSVGAGMVVEAAGGNFDSEDEDDFADAATRFFSKVAMQRWFAPVVYFVLLGPAGAVAYRLTQETQASTTPVGESTMRIIEWLPSRLMALSFAVFGNFDQTLSHLSENALSLKASTGEFFEDLADAALENASALALYDRLKGVFHLLERSFLLWLGVLALFVLI